MGIALVWEDGNGKVLEAIPDPEMHYSTLLHTADLSGTLCLRFIDPYGNTTFNQRQIPILIKELDALLIKEPDAGVRDHLGRVLELAERSLGKEHTCVKFTAE